MRARGQNSGVGSQKSAQEARAHKRLRTAIDMAQASLDGCPGYFIFVKDLGYTDRRESVLERMEAIELSEGFTKSILASDS